MTTPTNTPQQPATIRRSDVVLSWVPRNVCGAEDGFDGVLEAVDAYGITVWGWGEEPSGGLPVQLYAKMRARGVERIAACACWNILPPEETAIGHLLRTDSRYADARVVDMNGDPIPLPFWLVEGGNWMCSNHPGYREILRQKVTLIVEAGADTLQFDNHVTGTWQPLDALYWPTSEVALMAAYGGCFCQHCAGGFREYLQMIRSPDQLRADGIEDIASFDYRAVVRELTPTRRDFIAACERDEMPWIEQYREFHLQSCVALNAELKRHAATVAGRPVPLSANTSSLFPSELAAAHLLDQFVPEISYQGQPGGLAILPFKIAEALGKPIAPNASGESIAAIATERRFNALRRWIAASYAMGGNLCVPFRMWTHTDSDGLHWLDLPAEQIAPLYRFVRNFPGLLDDYRSRDQVKVLYSNAAVRRGMEALTTEEAANNREARLAAGADGEPMSQSPAFATTVHRVCWGLLNHNIAFGVALAGDDWFRHELGASELAGAQLVIIPEPAVLDATQAATLSANAAGRMLSWKNDGDIDEVLARITPAVAVEGDAPVWVLPREPVANLTRPVVIHVINADLDPETDSLNAQRDVVVRLDRSAFRTGATDALEWLTPDAPPLPLTPRTDDQFARVTIPSVDCWGVLRLNNTH